MAAEVVQYGRRKGAMRSSGSQRESNLRSGEAEHVKASKVAVVSSEEWERIQASLSRADREAEQKQTQLEARKNLHKTSKAIVSNWENTIEGQRVKKLQARKLREEKEEAERLKVDEEEARYQAERRKEAIERAKTLLYHQTDRAKHFHGALLLSEVLRERDAQVEYKKRREEVKRAQDEVYVHAQEEERERGDLADMEAARERAKARDIVAKFQLMQVAEKEHNKQQERKEALREQAELEKKVEEFHAHQHEIEAQHHSNRLTLRQQLDKSLADKQTVEQHKQDQERAEEEERKVFSEAKKRMMRLRKAKEAEIFQEFQVHQTRMCDLLQQQQQQQTSDEDERIARAVAEQEAKREREEREKEERFLEREREINCHMKEQLAEKRRREKEHAELDQQLLKQRIIQDQKFHAQQLERHGRAAQEAQELQQFHQNQMAARQDQKEAERKEEVKFNLDNVHLLQVEERQFQGYANKVIAEAESRGANTQPLRKAAKAGAGGGRGPVFSGKGGIRPSYQVMDSTAVQLPSYQPKVRHITTHNTQKRMGFTW